VHATSGSAVFTFTNVGDRVTGRLTTALTGDGDLFAIDQDACARRTLDPYQQCTVSVVLEPRRAGEFDAQLRVFSVDEVLDAEVAIKGKVTPPILDVRVSEATIRAGGGAFPELAVDVYNDGGAHTGVIGGHLPDGWYEAFNACFGSILKSGASCHMLLRHATIPDGAPLGTSTFGSVTISSEPGGTLSRELRLTVVPK